MSVRDRFRSQANMDVNMDYFFYACLEAERTHRFLNKDVTQTWPDMEDALAEGEKALPHLLEDLVAWYAANFPKLGENKVINYERLNEVADSIARLSIDLRLMIEKTTNKKFVIGQGEGIDAGHMHLWNLFEGIISVRFQMHGVLYLQYLHWCFDIQRPAESEVGDRPPVGRFMPPMRARFGAANQPDRQHGQGGRSGPPRNNAGGQGGGRSQGPQRGNGGGGRPQQQGGPRRGNDQRTQNGGRRGGSSHPDQQQNGHINQQASQAATDAALNEVQEAVQKLKEDPNLNLIPLRPCNSFLRRMQHEQAKNLGFFSRSEGEGKQRTVVVARTESEEHANA